jgi:hypothetical protein
MVKHMVNIKCRVYKVSGGVEDCNYNYLCFIPSTQPKDRDDDLLPRTYRYQRGSDGEYIGEWIFDKSFLDRLDLDTTDARLKLVAYNG